MSLKPKGDNRSGCRVIAVVSATLIAVATLCTGPVGIAAAQRDDPPGAGQQQDKDPNPESTQTQDCEGLTGGFQCFSKDVTALKTSATIALVALAGVGMLGGAGLLALGQQMGLKIMALSAFSGGGVLIGNGVVQIFT